METRWRDAPAGGWFSYQVKVTPDKPVILSCLYCGQDSDAEVSISSSTTKSSPRHLSATRGVAEFYSVETPIPPDLTRGSDAIIVRFQPHAGNTAGGVFDLRILSAPNDLRETPIGWPVDVGPRTFWHSFCGI